MPRTLTGANIFNGSSVASGGNILTSAIRPDFREAWRLTVVLTDVSVLDVTISDGATTVNAALRDGVPLEPDILYLFTLGVDPDYTYNFSPRSALASVPYFLLEAIRGKVL